MEFTKNSIYFNIIISVLSIFLVYKIALLIFNKESTALLSAFIVAIYPYFIFYSLVVMTETLFIFLVLMSFYFLFKKSFILASIFLTLAILTRPVIDILAPVLIFIFARFTFDASLKAALKKVLVYFVIYALLMMPWWLNNYRKFHQFQRLNPTIGGLFFTGNNVDYMKYEITRNPVYADRFDKELSEFKKIPDEVVRNKAYIRATLDYIKRNPGEYLKILFEKFIIFWKMYPTGEYRRYAWLSLVSYGFVLFFAVYYLIFLWGTQWRLVLPILIFIAYFTFVHLVLITSLRYRLPLDPFLIILCSYAITKAYSAKCKT